MRMYLGDFIYSTCHFDYNDETRMCTVEEVYLDGCPDNVVNILDPKLIGHIESTYEDVNQE